MTRLVLVRHGQAAAGWDADLDPGLSAAGRVQAEQAAAALAAEGPARPVLTSPLRRARETAAPLAARWGLDARVEPAVGEIASPSSDLAERTAWLGQVMGGRWPELDVALRRWRQGVLDALHGLAEDAVVFTHFIAINAVVGAATGDPRVVCFRPDNTSRTVVDVVDGSLRLAHRGAEAATSVQVGP